LKLDRWNLFVKFDRLLSRDCVTLLRITEDLAMESSDGFKATSGCG
jgi:hypothetical protein